MITLYKKGNSHIVRGVICELRKFGNDELDYAKSLGYITDPLKLEDDSAELSVKEIRALAKEAGIKNYSKKKVDELKKELGYEN